MKTALITGVSGYLGSHLAKELKKSGWKVVGIDVKHTSNQYVDFFQTCDVNDSKALHTLFDKIKIDVVFHLAGKIEVGESVKEPTVYYHNNTAGTNTLLNAMLYWGTKNIIYSSTAGVYKSKTETITEIDEVNPLNNPYAGSKYCAELAIRQSGLNYIIFRYFNLAGSDPDGEFGENHVPETHLIPKILQNLNNDVEIYGTNYNTEDGTCVRDYVHVSDVANAHILAADHIMAGKESHILNLGTGKGESVISIIKKIIEITKSSMTNMVTLPRRIGDPDMLVADITLAKKILTYTPKHDIISILQTAYNWHLKQNGK